jgi:hypothetical protein
MVKKEYNKSCCLIINKCAKYTKTTNHTNYAQQERTEMSFFPKEIKVESTSRYTKLDKGTTRIRMFGKPFFYYETWLDKDDGGRTPKRFALTDSISTAELGPDGIKQVMSIVIYNYNESAIQILSISQKTILKAIKNYSENSKYGDPTGYDINITKEGEGKQTRYTVIADPKEKAPKEAIDAYENENIELEMLLLNGDPFNHPNEKKPQTVDKDDLEF